MDKLDFGPGQYEQVKDQIIPVNGTELSRVIGFYGTTTKAYENWRFKLFAQLWGRYGDFFRRHGIRGFNPLVLDEPWSSSFAPLEGMFLRIGFVTVVRIDDKSLASIMETGFSLWQRLTKGGRMILSIGEKTEELFDDPTSLNVWLAFHRSVEQVYGTEACQDRLYLHWGDNMAELAEMIYDVTLAEISNPVGVVSPVIRNHPGYGILIYGSGIDSKDAFTIPAVKALYPDKYFMELNSGSVAERWDAAYLFDGEYGHHYSLAERAAKFAALHEYEQAFKDAGNWRRVAFIMSGKFPGGAAATQFPYHLINSWLYTGVPIDCYIQPFDWFGYLQKRVDEIQVPLSRYGEADVAEAAELVRQLKSNEFGNIPFKVFRDNKVLGPTLPVQVTRGMMTLRALFEEHAKGAVGDLQGRPGKELISLYAL